MGAGGIDNSKNKITMRNIIIGFFLLVMMACKSQIGKESNLNQEPHRPQFHFSPPQKWMNDPNGMVFYDGEFHLFYQHNPDTTVWGAMHWGHAISEDLVHWENLNIALYPDSLGAIFSGSAVVDWQNTTGFGDSNQPPLVAIFTYHNPVAGKKDDISFQSQAIAFSIDKGRSWQKYTGNPVLPNPGERHFRDPKVFWYAPASQWMMVLAVKDRVFIYSSPDLKVWNMVSEFGSQSGAHGGVWECPDLFPLSINGKEKWVMLVSLNPGGPNGGSATQYFIGDFDGQTFAPEHEDIRWLDYGPDNYAGVTWSNQKEKIFMGWMNNWDYANQVPTSNWRGAMTLPRKLELRQIDNQVFLASVPITQLQMLASNTKSKPELIVDQKLNLSEKLNFHSSTFHLQFQAEPRDFTIYMTNKAGDSLSFGFRVKENQFFIDRGKVGKVDFAKDFVRPILAPRINKSDNIKFEAYIDVASVELFIDDGTVVLTSVFFPKLDLTAISIETAKELVMRNVKVNELKSIWNNMDKPND